VTEDYERGLRREDAEKVASSLVERPAAQPPGATSPQNKMSPALRSLSKPVAHMENFVPARQRKQRRLQHNRPGAAEFTSERMLRPQALPPKQGWRRFVFKATGGLVNVVDERQRRERDLIGRIKVAITGTRRVAIISRKGGVGKTTTTLMLGHTFACHRGDRVIALDGNPDAGSLAYRVRRETSNNIMDLLKAPYDLGRYSDIRAFTNQASSRLEVLAAPNDPKITNALGEADYRRVAELCELHYNLACMDTGTGILESATRGILELADQVVVVMAPSLDSARTAASTLDWLEQNGHADLVGESVAVINALWRGNSDGSLEESFLNRSRLVETDRIEKHFQTRCRAVVRVPWDPQLDAGAEAELGDLSAQTRDAYLELAAVVADGF
jgi:putative peptide zinc metalloprotease protein